MEQRVEDLVHGGQRSYLKRDGWWVQLVLDEFDFLLAMGFKLTGSEMAGVHFHQKGHYIWFDGPTVDVAIEYDPDDPKHLAIGASVVRHEMGDEPPAFISLDSLISTLIPDATRPSRSPLDRAAVEANVRWWAACLRRIAPQVL